MRFLLLLFIVIPIIEMALLIKVGQWLGVAPTIGLVLLTAVIGLALLRQQGVSTLLRAQSRLQRGDVPAEEVLEGLMLAAGGALLLTPGFFTDVIGFAALLPFLRRRFATALLRRGVMASGGFGGGPFQAGGHVYEGEARRDREPHIIEIDYYHDQNRR